MVAGLTGMSGLSGLQSLYAADPEQANIVRRQMLAQMLMQQAQAPRDMRHPMAVYGSLAQSAAGALLQGLAMRDEDRIAAQRRDEEQNWLSGLRNPTAPAQPVAAPAVTQSSVPAPQQGGDNLDLAARVLIGEAGGEGPDGMAAAAQVMANRARLQGRTLNDVATAPGQFEAWGSRRPDLMALPDDRVAEGRRVLEGVTSGQIQAPEGARDATHFLNPDLQRQLGRDQPAWAPEGQGARIGRHVFYSRPGDFGSRNPNVTPASAEAPAPTTLQSAGEDAREVPGMPGVTVARLRQAVVQGLASSNPQIQQRAARYAQVLQIVQRGEALRPVSPGSSLVDERGQVIARIPDNVSESEKLLQRWRELAQLGENATPEQTSERDILARRLGGGGVNLTVPVNTERTLYGDIAQRSGERIDSLAQNASSGAERIRSGQRILSLLSDGAITGTGANTREAIERAFATAGLVDGRRVANTNQLMSELAQGTLESAGQLRGPTSDRDILFLREVAAGSINLTPDSIRRVTQIAMDRSQRDISRYNDIAQSMQDDPNVPPLLRRLYRPVEVPALDAQPTRQQNGVPTPRNAEEMNALEPGTVFRAPDGSLRRRP